MFCDFIIKTSQGLLDQQFSNRCPLHRAETQGLKPYHHGVKAKPEQHSCAGPAWCGLPGNCPACYLLMLALALIWRKTVVALGAMELL